MSNLRPASILIELLGVSGVAPQACMFIELYAALLGNVQSSRTKNIFAKGDPPNKYRTNQGSWVSYCEKGSAKKSGQHKSLKKLPWDPELQPVRPCALRGPL